MLTEGSTTLTWAEVYHRARRVSHALSAAGVSAGRPGGLPRPERHRVLRGLLRVRPARCGERGRQLAAGPGRDGRHHRRRRRRVLFFGPDYARGHQGVTSQVGCVTHVGSARPVRRVAGRLAVRRLGGACRPRFRAGPGRRGHPALHLGDHRPAQGSDDLGRNIACILRPRRTRSSTSDRTPCRWWPCRCSTSAEPDGPCAACPAADTRSSSGTSIRRRRCGSSRSTGSPRRSWCRPCSCSCWPPRSWPPPIVSSLRTVFYGASPISEDVLVRSMAALGCDFAQVYGLTETTGAITSLMPADHDPDGPRAGLLRSAGGPSTTWSCGSSTPTSGETAAGRGRWARCGPVGPEHARLLEQARGDGGGPRRRRLVPDRGRRMGGRTRGTCSCTTGSRT